MALKSGPSILACCKCDAKFSTAQMPVSIGCGHLACDNCLRGGLSSCPVDNELVPNTELVNNASISSILGLLNLENSGSIALNFVPRSLQNNPNKLVELNSCKQLIVHLCDMAKYLQPSNSDAKTVVCSVQNSQSNNSSASIQAHLIPVISAQISTQQGRTLIYDESLQLVRCAVNQLLSPYITHCVNVSSQLWTAVRARGCQFLGPAMQDEVLRLVLLCLSEGALISRKNLVMYIVQALEKDYPHASKTCVGHVVQLMYRASCFNVLKRDDESSLMQLKSEFRSYDALRGEHDLQIVQIALEASLRLTAEQWSSLLYADHTHRAHMYSVLDKLQSSQPLSSLVRELLQHLNQSKGNIEGAHVYSDANQSLCESLEYFKSLNEIEQGIHEKAEWRTVELIVRHAAVVLNSLAQMAGKRRPVRPPHQQAPPVPIVSGIQSVCTSSVHDNQTSTANSSALLSKSCPKSMSPLQVMSNIPTNRYKTSLCRDLLSTGNCSRGDQCTYAHSTAELSKYRSLCVAQQQQLNEQNKLQTNLRSPIIKNREYVTPNRVGFSPSIMNMPSPHAFPVNNPAPARPAQFVYNMAQLRPPGLPHPIPTNPRLDLGPSMNLMNVTSGVILVPPPPMPQPSVSNHQLHLKRDEIMKRLWNLQTGPSAAGGEFDPVMTDDDVKHVSYAVAASVLDLVEGNEHDIPVSVSVSQPLTTTVAMTSHMVTMSSRDWLNLGVKEGVSVTTSQLVLPPLTIPNAMVTMPWWCSSYTTNVNSDAIMAPIRPSAQGELVNSHVIVVGAEKLTNQERVSSPAQPITTSVPIASLRVPHDHRMLSAQPCTVQASNNTPAVKRAITESIVTATVVGQKSGPFAPLESMQTSTTELPRVMRNDAGLMYRPEPAEMSTQLDRIVQVKETINAAHKSKAPPGAVEKQQLRVELNIINRQLETLGRDTEVNCLLQELDNVNHNLQQINLNTRNPRGTF